MKFTFTTFLGWLILFLVLILYVLSFFVEYQREFKDSYIIYGLISGCGFILLPQVWITEWIKKKLK